MDETRGEGEKVSRVARDTAGGGFARGLWDEWRRRGWPRQGRPAVVAVSGGVDSTALLLALDELTRSGCLALRLLVAHLDHGLRGEAGAVDARWVHELAGTLGYECLIGEARVGERARAERDNLEQAARRARYEFLARAARLAGAEVVLTAHTLDDQAETILLRLLRGSGAEGLGGMRVERELEKGGGIMLRRPLLAWARRAAAVDYCRGRGVVPRFDALNEDERFARVRVRRRLMPLLAEFNPRAAEALSRAASLLREDADLLGALAAELLEEARVETEPSTVRTTANPGAGGPSARAGGDSAVDEPEGGGLAASSSGPALRVEPLAAAHVALRRRALRLWLEGARGDLRRIEAAHLLAVERLVFGARGGRVVELPGGLRVERRRKLLWLRPQKKD
ncbi:MAG TPA: tRNA lysidine(34) synthetase TilS [Pyrinomonadaceae bacterium]|nr:tRNA lysidine(34) synthetase TilS [Pyrinomonadaceae bacterium]